MLCVLVLLAGFAIVVALQPDDYRVERKATIAAPPAVVFAQINVILNVVQPCSRRRRRRL